MKKILLSACMLLGIAAGAQTIIFPDANFKNYLLESNAQNYIARDNSGNSIIIDANDDSEIQLSEALAVSWLDLEGAGITDATGLQEFLNLKFLSCSGNPNLTTLDLTPLSNLEEFYCGYYCVGLECYYTGLEYLTLAGLTNLKVVHIWRTNLDTIDLTGLTGMQLFVLHGVPVTNLDFSAMNLSAIALYNTNLTTVDVSNSSSLGEADFMGNLSLQNINLKNGNNSLLLTATDNPQLSFLCVDEGEDAILLPYFTNQNITPPAMSTNCSLVMANDKFTFENISVYPNPSKDIVKIDTDSEIKSIHLYDIHGRQLQVNYSNETNVSFDLSNRASGIYFIKIVTEKGMKVEKLIRE